MTPNEIADRYFASVRARDIDGLIALFAEDATFILPNGQEFKGAAAIREIQLGVFANGAPYPTPRAMVVGEKSLAVEVEARLPDGSVRHTANLYALDGEGKIQRLSVYMQGG